MNTTQSIPGPTDSARSRWERVHILVYFGSKTGEHWQISIRQFQRLAWALGALVGFLVLVLSVSLAYYYSHSKSLEDKLASLTSLAQTSAVPPSVSTHAKYITETKVEQPPAPMALVETTNPPFTLQNIVWQKISDDQVEIKGFLLPKNHEMVWGRICTVLGSANLSNALGWPQGVQLAANLTPDNCASVGEMVKFKKLRPVSWTFTAPGLTKSLGDKELGVYFVDQADTAGLQKVAHRVVE